MTHPELNAAREGLYRLLSRLYRQEVDAPLLERLRGMTFPQNCPQPELEAGYRALERWLSAGTEDALDALAVDFARVFLGAGSAEGCAAFPYESVYTSPKRLVMQDAWERVKSLYAAHGVRIDTDSSELMEDHIAYELAYMALLCREGAERAEQRAFLEEHLLTWVPAFCADLQRCAGTGFYRCVAQLTLGWLKLEEGLLQAEENAPSPFSCRVSTPALDRILEALGKEYRIYAPKRFPGRGARAGSDLVRYAPIRSAAEIVTDAPSDFSAKEIFYPVNQTMLYFQDDAYRESVLSDQREILIFARPCDINAVRRLDQIFLGNGGEQDVYYRRLREKVRFLLLECGGGWDTCFCVSMGSNRTEDYSLALRLEEGGALVQVKDPAFAPYFEGADACAYTPGFVEENRRAARLPVIPDRETLKTASGLDFWKRYDEQCIGCGGCNTVCPTCSCFDTVDVIYNETSRDGERRRVWSSCMLRDFTATAGGHRARSTPGANMRFKVLHKVYDYKARFGGEEHMCVGCGRCDRRCPKDISFYDAVCGFTQALEQEAEHK